MISSSIFTKLVLGTLTTAAVAGVAIVATDGPTEVVPEASASRPHMAAATTAQTPATPIPSRVRARPEQASAVPHSSPRDQPEEPGCETCSADGMPSFDALAQCQERFAVSEGGRVDINVKLKGGWVDAVTVRSQSEDDDELVACLNETLPGSEASISEGQTPPEELNLALLPSTIKVPDQVDAPTPTEMAADGGLPVRAEGDAPVRTVVACADYDCQFCDKARVTLDQVLDEYPDLQLAWMQFPLHDSPSALLGARAAVAAQAQGKFWEMHALLFDRPAQREDGDVRAMAKELDLDLAQFERDFAADSTLETIDAQKASCVAAGAMGTPSFFFGDTVMVGAQPIEAFRKLLD